MAKKQPTKEVDAVVESGIYVYIGPTIRGVVQNGTVFRDTEKDKLIARVKDKERISRLIVRDVDLASAKEKLKKGGNSLSVAYNALLAAK